MIEGYAKESAAPVRANTTVTSVRRAEGGYVVQTDQDLWHARIGRARPGRQHRSQSACAAGRRARRHHHAHPGGLPQPGQLPDGGVLVVGASASGIQIAAELHRSGRQVSLAVGEHVRMPRTYRGKDILWWMDAAGLLDERYDEIPDLARARNLPSMQLVGSPDRTTVDLNSLSQAGVQLVGRLAGIRDGIAQFSGSLPNMCTLADLKLERLLDTIDAWATKAAGTMPIRRDGSHRPPFPRPPPLTLDLRSGAIRTILWATGFRPDLSWLDVACSTERAMSATTAASPQARACTSSACRSCAGANRP